MPNVLWETPYAYVADKGCANCDSFQLETRDARWLVRKPHAEHRLRIDLDAEVRAAKILGAKIYPMDTYWVFMVDLVARKRDMDVYREVTQALAKLGVSDWYDLRIDEIGDYGAEMFFKFRL